MSGITYQEVAGTKLLRIRVKLDGKTTGYINEVPNKGYQYTTNGKAKGELFKTVAQVKQSLEQA